MEIDVPCVVDPSALAILEADHRVFVNYEAYYLSGSDALAKFIQEPWRYTGKVTDPVSKNRFQPDADSLVAMAAGRLFYFSSEDNAETFAATPDEYSTPVVPYAGRM